MRAKPSPQHQVSEQIGKELRAIYDGVLHEPIPDRFRALLERLGDDMPSTAADARGTFAPRSRVAAAAARAPAPRTSLARRAV